MRKMACTTILVGKKASYDGSKMIANTVDSGPDIFKRKKLPWEHPKNSRKPMFLCSPM